jgi:hypothetical protein
MFLLDHGNAIESTEQRSTIRHLRALQLGRPGPGSPVARAGGALRSAAWGGGSAHLGRARRRRHASHRRRPIRLAKPQRTGCGRGGMAFCQRSPRRRTSSPCPRWRRSSSERDLPEGRSQRGSVVDQQFGRAKERERAGSTGRAGRSEEGKRLTYRFLMDSLLSCCGLQIKRSEQLRKAKRTDYNKLRRGVKPRYAPRPPGGWWRLRQSSAYIPPSGPIRGRGTGSLEFAGASRGRPPSRVTLALHALAADSGSRVRRTRIFL